MLTTAQIGRENVFVRKAFYRFFLPSLFSCLGLAVGGLAD